MDEDNKDPTQLNELHEVLAASDQWLRELGVVTDYHHNSILVNIYTHFSEIKYASYLFDNKAKVMALKVYIDPEEFLLGKYKKTLNKVKKWIPFKNRKLEELIDIAHYSNLPFIEQKRKEMEQDLKDLISQYLPEFKVNIEIIKYEEGVEEDA
jgi:hypothetical protein